MQAKSKAHVENIKKTGTKKIHNAHKNFCF